MSKSGLQVSAIMCSKCKVELKGPMMELHCPICGYVPTDYDIQQLLRQSYDDYVEDVNKVATRVELLKALKVIKEHCKVSDCDLCEINNECDRYLDLIDSSHTFSPCNWDLEDGEPNE